MFTKTVKYEDLLQYPRYKKVYSYLRDKKITLVDSLSFYYSFKEIFEQEIYKFEANTDNPYIIDCGTNIGSSIFYFKELYPNAKIIGFEADPEVYKICRKNIEAYNLKNVDLHNKALWNCLTELDFMSEGADGGRLDSKLSDHKKVKVKTDILSSYIDKEVDFLKIDIEGAEFKVMEECQKNLTKVQNIFVEYHSFANEEQNLDGLLRILSHAGFRYQINTQMASVHPFIKNDTVLGMDLQLNIFGYRRKQ